MWDKRWLDLCRLISTWSKDTSTKVGCVIVDGRNTVLSLGWNGIPRGVEDSVQERQERPEKYYWYEHAERNAIYNAASTGRSLEGSTLYVTYFPCADCARGVIQAGVKKVVFANPAKEGWVDSASKSFIMLQEAGVEIQWKPENLITEEN